MNVRAILQFFSVLGFVVFAALGVEAAVPATGELSFTVMREGDDIGTHRLKFRTDDRGLAVDIQTDIAVKVFGVALYRFEHEGHEIWRENHLVSIVSETNDDGTPHHLNATATEGALMVDGDARQESERLAIIPASLWNNELVSQTELLNTLDGSNMPVTILEIGPEVVEAWGRNVSATHYSVTGKLNRELWYDADGILVQVKFGGADGSEITYILE